MVRTELCLPFAPVGGGLIHSAQLDAQVVTQPEPNTKIGSVPVKVLNFAAVSNIGLTIDENLIVQGQVDDSLPKIGGIERYIHKYIVPVAGTEVLLLQPALLRPETVGKQKTATQPLGKKSFLINPVFMDRVGAFSRCARCDTRIAQCEGYTSILWGVRQSISDQHLLQVIAEVPESELIIALNPEGAISKPGIVKVHVPGSQFVFFNSLGRKRAGKPCTQQ